MQDFKEIYFFNLLKTYLSTKKILFYLKIFFVLEIVC